MQTNVMECKKWGHCARLASNQIELQVTLDFGPRVIRFGFTGEQNLFKESPEVIGTKNKWVNYGGHRLWHAPEIRPRTYSPDNAPVEHAFNNGTLTVTQSVEPDTGILKQMELRLVSETEAEVRHRLTNQNPWAIELAPWALSVMAPGGTSIVPQEKFKPHTEALLPARPLVLWHYTDMSDPRFTWGRDYILLRQDAAAQTPQKFGILNKKGRAGYVLGTDLFIKRFDPQAEQRFPDYGCNTELFTNTDMLEVESLGPLQKLEPGATAEHTEVWSLHKLPAASTSKAELFEAAQAHGL